MGLGEGDASGDTVTMSVAAALSEGAVEIDALLEGVRDADPVSEPPQRDGEALPLEVTQ